MVTTLKVEGIDFVGRGTGKAEKVVRDLAKLVNKLANTDHQQIFLSPMITSDQRAKFEKEEPKVAKVGYAFDTKNRVAYFVLDGAIDPIMARDVLAETYLVSEVNQIPNTDILNIPRDSCEIKSDDLQERIRIETGRPDEPASFGIYQAPVAVNVAQPKISEGERKAKMLWNVYERRVKRGELTKEVAEQEYQGALQRLN